MSNTNKLCLALIVATAFLMTTPTAFATETNVFAFIVGGSTNAMVVVIKSKTELDVQITRSLGKVRSLETALTKFTSMTNDASAWILTESSEALKLIEDGAAKRRVGTGNGGTLNEYTQFRFATRAGFKPEAVIVRLEGAYNTFILPGDGAGKQ